MLTIHHSILINAPRAHVADVMLADATYREWTAPFHPGSYFEGDWSEGSKMLFLGPSEDGAKPAGMVARIKEHRPAEFVSIEHLGFIADGVEDTTSDEARAWAPAFENYTFTDVEGGTLVQVDVDTAEKYVAMFEDMWPKALAVLKEVAERG